MPGKICGVAIKPEEEDVCIHMYIELKYIISATYVNKNKVSSLTNYIDYIIMITDTH